MKQSLFFALITGLAFTGLTQLTPPAVPTGLRTSMGDTQNALVWNASTDKGLASYYIYGGTSPNPTDLLVIVNAPATSYLHTGLNNGTTYYYRMTAVNAVDKESAPTADVTATPGKDASYELRAASIKAALSQLATRSFFIASCL